MEIVGIIALLKTSIQMVALPDRFDSIYCCNVWTTCPYVLKYATCSKPRHPSIIPIVI